jgi:TP901 family phage tail tape measure protein
MADTNSTVQFKADISQLKSAMQTAQRQVKLANSEFKAASAGMDDWADSADGLKAKLKQLDTTLKSQKTQLSLLEDEYDKTVDVYGENSAAADRVKISINNMKASIAKTESQINTYSQELKDCEDGTGRFAEETDNLDDAARNAGDGFTVFKGILSDLISNIVQWGISELKDLATEVVEVGSSFEKSMSNVAALSGATEEELQLLSDTAKEFGSSTQFSASEAADALSYMALAGWDAETSASALGGVLDLAASSGMDLASASDMVTDYMSAFSMEASESAYFADLLSYAQSNANTTAEGLGEAFRNCAANMNAAGQDVETTTALLSSMANQGLKGSEAGTALTAVMRDLTSKMEDGSIKIGDVAVEVQDAEGNFRDLTDILKDVEDATDGMGDAEKSAALMTTFTSDSIKGLNLILNEGVDSAADFEDALRNSTGTAKEMSKTMNDNLSGDITALNSKLEGIKITVYESMAPALRNAVAMISEALDEQDWEEVGKQLGDLAVKAVDFFTTVMENADGVKSVLTAVGTALGTAFVVSKVLTFASTISSLYTTFKALKTATDVATTSQLLLNAAQAATPIGLVTAAVAGLAAGLIYLASKSDEAKGVTSDLTEAEEEQIAKVDELAESYKELNSARDEEVAAINTEYSYYESLADELDSLVDANGNVKEGYEDRVNFILTTLNDAVGTEMELVDGVIQNYQDEKDAIYELIEAKKAEAVLSANEEAYTTAIQNQNEALQNYITTQGIFQQNVSDMEEAQSSYNEIMNMTTAEYAELNGLTYDMGTASQQLANDQEALGEKLLSAKAAVGESRVAMETAKTTYEGYQATIKNYEGLSSAIISGDSDKISQALLEMEYSFQTAETSTRESLEQQVENYETNLEALKQAIEDGTPGVTQEMVDQAQSMVDAAKEELDKLPDEAADSANAGASSFANTLGSSTNQTKVRTNSALLLDAANSGVKPNGEEQTAGNNFTLGYVGGMKLNLKGVNDTANNMGSGAVNALNEGQDSHSPSAATTTSGENFGQGFINGMNNKESSIWTKAYNLAKTALSALKKGQEEGSPSKLTRQSGIFFGEGYDEGIESMKTSIKKTAGNLATTAYNSLRTSQKEGSPSKLTYASGVNFTKGYINGISSMQKQLQVAVKNMTTTALKTAMSLDNYNFSEVAQNAADYLADELSNKTDYMIAKITYQNEAKLADFDSTISKLESERDSKTSALQTKIDATKDDVTKKTLKNQKAAIEKQYAALIATQNKYKTAYQTASSEMLTEFTEAVNSYSSKAQDLINSTIGGVSDKYQEKYDELINKQNTLISKLKSAGDLFEVSGAGIMTVNDITEQTKQIKDYTAKLQAIKEKVSADLFDEIAGYDMKEGSAFIDRLLALSDADLQAYSDAYDEKMSVAEKLSEDLYKDDFKNVAKDYQTELEKAFKGLPAQLEAIGNDAMKGFVNGLTQNTDYLDSNVRTFVNGMVDQFKSMLKIKSPSRVMMDIGGFTGQGFVNGLKEKINNVKQMAETMAQAVATPLDGVKTDIGSMKANIGDSQGLMPQTTNVVNNYNLTQNNTSPKSLTALETYQARRQQIAMVKAMT